MNYIRVAVLSLCVPMSVEASEHRMLRHKSAQNMYDEGIRPDQGKLYFPHMQVTTLEDLPFVRYQFQCDALTEIHAPRNHLLLRDLIVVLKQAPNLGKIDFSHNEVHEIRDIPEHVYLKTIQLNDNHIKRFDVKNFFTSLSKLQTCLLHNNPLHADDVINVRGYYPKVEAVWFDEGALTRRTMVTCIKIFPNLGCELVPGSRAVQTRYAKREIAYFGGFYHDDLVFWGGVATLCGALGGGIYGMVSLPPWAHSGERGLNMLLYGMLGAGVGVALFLSYAAFYNRRFCEKSHFITYERIISRQPVLLEQLYAHNYSVLGQEEFDPTQAQTQ